MSLSYYRQKFYPRIDPLILVIVAVLSLFGLLMISSSSVVVAYERFGNNYYYVTRQAIALGLGLVTLAIFSAIDYHRLRRLAVPLFVVALILLILVFIPGIGLKLGGAYRWIDFGFISIQPSEIAKLTFIIYLAAWLDSRQRVMANWQQGLAPFILLLLVMGLLLIGQPDMGTLVVISLIAAIMLFGAGLPISHLLIGTIGAAAVLLILIRSSTYRWQRFLTFLNPQLDVLGAGYQINQSLLSIGSGGWLGVGFGQSLQKYLYLPQPHIDAILAIIVEEMGFARTLILIGIFVVLGLRGLLIARQAPDNFGRLISVGIIGWIIGQAFLNMAATLGSIPLTGIPLPFISFGGTALVTLMIGVGILLNISKHTAR